LSAGISVLVQKVAKRYSFFKKVDSEMAGNIPAFFLGWRRQDVRNTVARSWEDFSAGILVLVQKVATRCSFSERENLDWLF
jgi:hypothetical protein